MAKKSVEDRIKMNGAYWKERFGKMEESQYQSSAAYYKDVQE